jgi:hypothetical protein
MPRQTAVLHVLPTQLVLENSFRDELLSFEMEMKPAGVEIGAIFCLLHVW